MGQLDERVVVITGASRGMGTATARLLAGHGALVVLGARDEAALADLARDIRSSGGEVAYRVTDVTVLGDVRALVDLVVSRYGRVDAVIANAGVAVNAPLVSAAVEDWDRMIDVNLRGVLHTIAATVPLFQRQGFGHFIAIGSTAAAKWVPGQGVYAATKAGVRALTDVLRQELAPLGIRVTFVSPGFTDTGFIDSTRDPDERAALEARRDATAMSPDTVAAAIVYALSQPDSVNVGELTVRPTIQP